MYKCYFDGSCEPVNPGGTGRYGFVVYKDGENIYCGHGMVGKGPLISNNLAEYAGLRGVLDYLITNDLTHEEIMVYGDSMLVVNQMSKRKNKFNGLYKPMAVDCLFKLKEFNNIQFKWIPRELNKEADELSKLEVA